MAFQSIDWIFLTASVFNMNDTTDTIELVLPYSGYRTSLLVETAGILRTPTSPALVASGASSNGVYAIDTTGKNIYVRVSGWGPGNGVVSVSLYLHWVVTAIHISSHLSLSLCFYRCILRFAL